MLKRPALRLLAALLLLPVSLQVVGACQLGDINWQAQDVWPQILAACERPAEESERWLYSWGHEEKIALLTHNDYGPFRLYNDAQQFAFAGVQARQQLGGYENDPMFPVYVARLRTSLGLASVAELYRNSRNPEMLVQLQGVWRGLLSEHELPAPEESEARTAARMGLTALAFNQVYPGFLDDLPHSLEELLATTREQLQATDDPQEKLRLQGRLLGLQRASRGGGFEANISYGPAIYFSKSPARFLGHYAGAQYSGIACRLQDSDRIVDISNAEDRQALLQHDIFLRNPAGAASRFPGGYNQLAHPQRYRQAVLGRIVKHNEVYSDVGLIHYAAPGVCRRIRLTDFRACPDVTGLLRDGQFMGGKQAGALFRLLTIDDEQQRQLKIFLGLVRACTVTPADVERRQQQQLPPLANSCDNLQDGSFQNSHFYRQQKKFLDEVVRKRCS